MADVDPGALDRTLAGVFAPGTLYAVGGRVRDEIRTALDDLARPPKDLDYVVTGIDVAELVARLERVGAANVGASFAVVKATIDGTTVDVAVPRRERSTGVGHRAFSVDSGPDVSLEEDLARRDFRMNMIARALPSGELVDPYGGEADIRARRIDLLRPEAFDEDPLRMLRAAQFAARFAYRLSAETFERMRVSAPLVASVSAERVRDEVVKLLAAARPSVGFDVLRETGVLAVVLPEIAEGIGVEQNEYHAYDVYRHALATLDAAAAATTDPMVRLAALLHDVGKPQTKDGPHFYRHEIVGAEIARALLGRLRFSADEIDLVTGLVRQHMYATGPELTDSAVRRFIKRVGADRTERQFALRHADVAGSGLPKRENGNAAFEARVRAEIARSPALSSRDLDVDGRDVLAALERSGRIAKGARGGPLDGRILDALVEDVLDDPTRNDRVALLARIDELAARDAIA